MNRNVLITLIGLTVVACLQSPQSDTTANLAAVHVTENAPDNAAGNARATSNSAQSAVEVKNNVTTLQLTPLDATQPAITAPSDALLGTAAELNAAVVDAYVAKRSHVWVTGQGQVVKVLADDRQGARHQRFLLRINPQQTLLISHNIDLAPRIDQLQVGDTVRFKGEYIYNPKGGILHWTHHDPQGRLGGYLSHAGRTYQ